MNCDLTCQNGNLTGFHGNRMGFQCDIMGSDLHEMTYTTDNIYIYGFVQELRICTCTFLMRNMMINHEILKISPMVSLVTAKPPDFVARLGVDLQHREGPGGPL
jgi:hypothetical protein